MQTLVERYLVFVRASALRQMGDAAQADEVTRAVFLVLTRRAGRLRKKTVLAGWLFYVTAIACRKLRQERIGHPWIGENRFIERVMAVEEFRRIYRSHLEDFVSRLYVPERLHRRIDEIAAVIREPIAAQSSFRLDKFEQAVGIKPVHPFATRNALRPQLPGGA